MTKTSAKAKAEDKGSTLPAAPLIVLGCNENRKTAADAIPGHGGGTGRRGGSQGPPS